MREFYGIPFAQASRAKALFDYLYLRPGPRAQLDKGYDLAEDLRLNLDEFSLQEREEFGGYVMASHLTKLIPYDRTK